MEKGNVRKIGECLLTKGESATAADGTERAGVEEGGNRNLLEVHRESFRKVRSLLEKPDKRIHW